MGLLDWSEEEMGFEDWFDCIDGMVMAYGVVSVVE